MDLQQLHQYAPQHGGDLDTAQREFGKTTTDWLDLSTGINPNPYPDLSISLDSISRLPQKNEINRLLAVAATAYGSASAYDLAAAPGSQAILQVLPTLRSASHVAVVSPTYEEHVATWSQQGHRVSEIASLSAYHDADVVVVVNPNNPDGKISSMDDLEDVASRLASTGGWLVVDEAFADVTPTTSLFGQPALPNTVIVRSFGKFFGLAGLRLGFVAGTPDILCRINDRLGPWAVSGPAVELGTRALADTDWIETTRRRLASMRRRLDQVLTNAGLPVIGGTDLFRLVETGAAQDIYRLLGQAGILVRRFDRQTNWLRVGLPRSDRELQRFSTVLDKVSSDA